MVSTSSTNGRVSRESHRDQAADHCASSSPITSHPWSSDWTSRVSEANHAVTPKVPLTGRSTTRPFLGGEDEVPATSDRELEMEQYLSNLSAPSDGTDLRAVVQPNVWLLSAEEIPPILFTTEEVARLLGIGKCRVYDLIRQRGLRSVKVGASRRISARALSDFVAHLEVDEPA